MSKKRNPNRAKVDATKRSKNQYAREATAYEGVWYRTGTHRGTGRPEKIFYVVFARGGKRIETMVGREQQDAMTAAKASRIRAEMIDGDMDTRKEQREAEEAARKADAGRWTFARLWDAWKRDPEQGHLIRDDGSIDFTVGKRGTKSADLRYRKHIKEPLGDREPKDLIIEDIDRIRYRLAKTHSKETTKSVLNLINRIARYGFKKGYCPGLPFVVEMNKKQMGREPRIKEAPTDDQIRRYVQTCRDWPDRQAGNFQLLLCYTGMRRSSAWNLKWEDVNLDTGRIILRNTKNTRDIPITLAKDAVELLHSHPRTEGNPYVFTGAHPSGKRSDRQVEIIPRRIRDAAGLPKSFDPNHVWRINLATQGRRRGVDTFYIQKMGGWESPRMVDHYAKVNEDTLRDAVEKVSSVLRVEDDANARAAMNGNAS